MRIGGQRRQWHRWPAVFGSLARGGGDSHNVTLHGQPRCESLAGMNMPLRADVLHRCPPHSPATTQAARPAVRRNVAAIELSRADAFAEQVGATLPPDATARTIASPPRRANAPLLTSHLPLSHCGPPAPPRPRLSRLIASFVPYRARYRTISTPPRTFGGRWPEPRPAPPQRNLHGRAAPPVPRRPVRSMPRACGESVTVAAHTTSLPRQRFSLP